MTIFLRLLRLLLFFLLQQLLLLPPRQLLLVLLLILLPLHLRRLLQIMLPRGLLVILPDDVDDLPALLHADVEGRVAMARECAGHHMSVVYLEHVCDFLEVDEFPVLVTAPQLDEQRRPPHVYDVALERSVLADNDMRSPN